MNTAKKIGFEILERLIIVSFKCLSVLIAPNGTGLIAVAAFSEHPAPNRCPFFVLLLKIRTTVEFYSSR
jgi:hypothetical protein